MKQTIRVRFEIILHKLISLIGIKRIPEYFSSREDECDGCAKHFHYPMRKYFYYKSCSKECDEIIIESIK